MNQGGANPKYESIISVESCKSNLSNPPSLGLPSFKLGDFAIQKKTSLIYAMSIESDHRKSDIFEHLLQSEKKQSQRPLSIINSTNHQFAIQPNFYQSQRNSDFVGSQKDIEIDHQCSCFQVCLQFQCVCFKAKNQICVKGTCCSKCVKLKSKKLKSSLTQMESKFQLQANNVIEPNQYGYDQAVKGLYQVKQSFCNCKNTECLKSYCKCFQNGEFCNFGCGCESCKNKQHSAQRQIAFQSIKQFELIYCTCKKTKCNKKYCSCYALGVKCGKHCQCQNCSNCIPQEQMDIEIYEGQQQQDFKNNEVPQRMSFEPVKFQ